MQDGIAENHTAAMLEPLPRRLRLRHRTNTRALASSTRRRCTDYVTALDAHGFQVHFHALGDRAVREALDAVEAARAANGRATPGPTSPTSRWSHPDDVPRFRTLGATANIQPLWAAHEPQMDELTIPFLGPERAAWQYPFGDLLRSGATLAAGSDWPVSSPDPIQGIHVAVNRTPPGRGRRPVFLPEQRIDLGSRARGVHRRQRRT